MILEEAIEFLKDTPPFSSLDSATLREISHDISMEFHPSGSVIFQQNGPAAGYLGIIRQGEVKVFLRTNEGEEVLIEYLGEGDSIGLLSLITGDLSRDNAVAAKDTVCYAIKKETVIKLVETVPSFSAFFLKYYLKKVLSMMYREINERSLIYGGGDKALFTVALSDLVGRDVISAPMGTTIREAAEKMARHKISSLVLLDPDGFPAGIVTDRDLRDKVIAKGRDTSEPVSNIMSVTLIKSEARDYCFEALLKMIRYQVHHLLVVDRGEIKGMLTDHDLMLMQGTSPLAVAREIEDQRTIDGLVPAARKISRTIELLVKEGAKAGNITRIITEVNDRLLRKVIEITEKRFGRPPVSYCWIVFGSEGRKEQTFRTDQDNAIIYDDPGPEDEDAAKGYFSDFTLFTKEALARCGFPPCPADYMASNPQWRQPLSVWKDYFSEWIGRPLPESILKSLIFFDFRPVHGNFMLAEKLRAYLGAVLRKRGIFFPNMAGDLARQQLPLGIFKTLSVDKRGLDIKINGISYIIDIARLFALDLGVYNTSTIERLREAKGRNRIVDEFGTELEQAFEFFMGLRVRHQYAQIRAGLDPDNRIDVGKLSLLERKFLEESYRIIARVQELIRKQYHAVS